MWTASVGVGRFGVRYRGGGAFPPVPPLLFVHKLKRLLRKVLLMLVLVSLCAEVLTCGVVDVKNDVKDETCPSVLSPPRPTVFHSISP